MQAFMNIGVAERDTGLSKDTLRIWERRYGYPTPMRDSQGERSYSMEQIEKLRILKRLLDKGYRPGKIIHYTIQDLQQLAQPTPQAAETSQESDAILAALHGYIGLCKSHQFRALRDNLGQTLSRMGLERFIIELLVPLNQLVGEAWADGTLQIFEEHLYTESVQNLLRMAIASLPRSNMINSPRILLTTLPQEQHGLGLLMAEALLALEGANCFALGVQTPIIEIVNAVKLQKIDIVAISCSEAMNPRKVLEGLTELREKLPAYSELWAGGQNAALLNRPPANITVSRNLESIKGLIVDWKHKFK